MFELLSEREAAVHELYLAHHGDQLGSPPPHEGFWLFVQSFGAWLAIWLLWAIGQLVR